MKSKIHTKFKAKYRSKTNYKLILMMTIATFLISMFLTFISNIIIGKVSIPAAFIILIIIVLFGIFCDILGVALAGADMTQYNAMASDKVRGAREAIFLVKHASLFATFFNDVIGDVCGIVSGTTISVMIVKAHITGEVMPVIFSAIIAAITVGGKALGKGFSIKNSGAVVYKIGYIGSFLNPANYIKTTNKRSKKNKKIKKIK